MSQAEPQCPVSVPDASRGTVPLQLQHALQACVWTQALYMQNLKQQVKAWETNSPSHMQLVAQHPVSLKADPDGGRGSFDSDRQQVVAGASFNAEISHSCCNISTLVTPKVVGVLCCQSFYKLLQPFPAGRSCSCYAFSSPYVSIEIIC